MSTLTATTARGRPTGELGRHLRPCDVDVWRAPLDDQPRAVVEQMGALLSADELERANRFYFERDRSRYIVCRGVLRTLLGHYLGRRPATIAFVYGPHGKPALAPPEREPLYFNVAHSDALALFAFTRVGEVGVDVERIRDLPDWQGVAEAAFAPRELARLKACPPEAQREEFFRAWAKQEAVLKALGTGLAAAEIPDDVTFTVQALNPAPGYAGAIAAAPGARCDGGIRGWEAAQTATTNIFARSGTRSADRSNLDQPLS